MNLAFYSSSPMTTFNGFNTTPNYYSTTGVDGSMARSLGAQPSANLAYTGMSNQFWSGLMSTQQNLFAGWSNFGGCAPSPRPQTPQGQCQGHNHPRTETEVVRNGNRIDVNIHHYRCADGSTGTYSPRTCGGPFSSPGSSASSTNQSYGCFGAYGRLRSNSPGSYAGLVNNYFNGTSSNTGNGYTLASCGYQPTYGSYGGQNTAGQYGGSVGQAYGGYPQIPSYGSVPTNNAGFQYQTLPTSYNWNDLNYSFGNSSSSPFGVVPSSFGDYAMSSPFTSMGTATTISLLGSALSLFF